MRRMVALTFVALLVFGMLGGGAAFAHQAKAVGPDGQYLVIVGFEKEPIFTDERNGLVITVRRADDREPVENLEQTLFVEIIAPDGQARRELSVRARHGQPGSYIADILLGEPGEYALRIWGHIFDVEFEEEFHTHHVTSLSELRFP